VIFMATQNVLCFWAKKSEDNAYHYPLLYHMLDAFAVCREIWEKCLHESARQSIACRLQLSEMDADAAKWVSFWVGLHDIGKATPDFQGNSDSLKQELARAGFTFNSRPQTYHGTATACILQEFFQNSLDRDLAKKISVTVGGHHGKFPLSVERQETRLYLGDRLWNDARAELYECMIDLCGMRDVPTPKGSPGNAFFMVLAGLTSVADWIASSEKFFPYQVKHDLESHPDYARLKAMEALDKLGWTGWQPASDLFDFQKLFTFSPRPLQVEAISLTKDLKNQPCLVIIEAPMGEGKTEAAIYLADSWVTNLKQKGYYFALPTMATSDQMFGRVEDYLEKRYPDSRVNFMLLHGHAALSAEFKILKDKFEVNNSDADKKDPNYDNASPGVVASEWFTSRKRGLLAPFGVGTIDQALLAVLQTRHVFVRLFGLAHKTIIIDEVHAYDAYMTTLLERLLEWLAALGSSVVLLSATLPKERKDALLKAYQNGLTGQDKSIPGEVIGTKYPRISWTTRDKYNARTIETSEDSKKELQLQWVNGLLPEGDTDFELGESLRAALTDGGCAAVICNTVDRAQQVYDALKPYFPEQDAGDGYPELDLFHARYLYGDRQDREKRTLKRFGKDECYRPRKRAVLVATQIIEQSLDLDFDLIVTEMAPVDILLQRAGRLHRHQHKKDRPGKLKTPTLWICQPEIEDGVPCFGRGTEAVYDYHILLRSWLVIKNYVGQKPINIPGNVEELIEEVYEEQSCPPELSDEMKKKWETSRDALERKRDRYKSTAKSNRILPPYYEDEILEDFNHELEEDNPKIHATLQALTRLSESPSISVICLLGDIDKPCLDATSHQVLNTQTPLDVSIVGELLKHSTQLSHKTIVHLVIKSNALVFPAWRKEALLRHHYLLFFNERGNCKSEFPEYKLSLNDELGLVISKKEE